MLTAIRTSILMMILCVSASGIYAQSACTTATNVSSGATCSYNTYSLQGATTAQQASSSCTGASTIYGTWYKWTVGSTGPKFTFRNIGASISGSLYIEVFAGVNCTNLSPVKCQQVTGAAPITIQAPFTYEDIGLTYYFRVFTT